MNETIRKILLNQKKKMLMVFGGNSVKMESRIFVTSTGKVINEANFLNVMKRILRELDKKGVHLERFSHHAFRDTFATRYIEHGGNMQTLKTIPGHSTLAMTADLYAHVIPSFLYCCLLWAAYADMLFLRPVKYIITIYNIA